VVGVDVGVAVGVAVGVLVGVLVGVAVGVFVGVAVGVLVGVAVGAVSLSAIVPSTGFVPVIVALAGADRVRLKFSVPSKTRSSRVGAVIVCVNVVVLAVKVSVPLVVVKSDPAVAVPFEVA
jgi:hypothetical protein